MPLYMFRNGEPASPDDAFEAADDDAAIKLAVEGAAEIAKETFSAGDGDSVRVRVLDTYGERIANVEVLLKIERSEPR